jgi:hypothetical protein
VRHGYVAQPWIHPGYVAHMDMYQICSGYISSKYPKKSKQIQYSGRSVVGHYSPSLDTFWPSPFEQARMGHGEGGGGCMQGWRRWPGEDGRGVGARRCAGTPVAKRTRGHQQRPAVEARPPTTSCSGATAMSGRGSGAAATRRERLRGRL